MSISILGTIRIGMDDLPSGQWYASFCFRFLSIFLLRRATAFSLPSPYESRMSISKMPNREYAQSSSRVVLRVSAHLNRSSTLNSQSGVPFSA